VKSQGGCLSTAAALNAQTEAPAGGPASTPSAGQTPSVSTGGGGGGMSTGTKILIVGAVAGGAAGAAFAFIGHKSSTSP
jgi:hypothetical protein